MKLKFLTSNSKLRKDGIYGFDIPAYKSSTGFITCPLAKDCIANCYARQGTYVFKGVKAKYERNLESTQNDDFVLDMIIDIIESKAQIIRIHSSGDFYNREYIAKWLYIIESLPHVTFYAYTKSFSMFDYNVLPTNFKLIQSQGGVHAIDESKPHAKVFDSVDSFPSNYANASESDLVAVLNDKIALHYHGSKKHNGNAFINKKAA
ncbi:MAG: GP88 family protein [Bacteroidales bacterium]